MFAGGTGLASRRGILYSGDRKKDDVGALFELKKSKKGKFTFISHTLSLLTPIQSLTLTPFNWGIKVNTQTQTNLPFSSIVKNY